MGKEFSLRKPCSECPFSRTGTPLPHQIGNPLRYIGQAVGPFRMPCHSDPDYQGQGDANPELAQCAGFAILRANIGVDKKMPPPIHKLPADKEVAFASLAEFLAHRTGGTVEEAEAFLKVHTPEQLFQIELRQPGAKFFPIKKKE
jgi:hypothetical protein